MVEVLGFATFCSFLPVSARLVKNVQDGKEPYSALNLNILDKTVIIPSCGENLLFPALFGRMAHIKTQNGSFLTVIS